jgi:hypothetical protein
MMKFPKSVKGLEGADNISGLKQTIWVGRVDQMTTIAETIAKPTDTPAPTDITEFIRIAADHVFSTGNGFHKLYTTMDTGALEQAMPASRDQTGSLITVRAQHPGNKEEAAAFLSYAPNYEWIVLVETPDGKFLQVGQEGLTASIKAGKNTNNLTGERNAHNIEITAFMPRLLYYEGEIQVPTP